MVLTLFDLVNDDKTECSSRSFVHPVDHNNQCKACKENKNIKLEYSAT